MGRWVRLLGEGGGGRTAEPALSSAGGGNRASRVTREHMDRQTRARPPRSGAGMHFERVLMHGGGCQPPVRRDRQGDRGRRAGSQARPGKAPASLSDPGPGAEEGVCAQPVLPDVSSR